jgi:hypothetical protein
MIGVQDFCGHYEWTFQYIFTKYGKEALERYWGEAIAFDSQSHAFELIRDKGFDGMEEYWGHTLTMEEAGYTIARTEDLFRIDMHACPSKGFLIDRGLEQFHDYCAHCMGWIGPVARRAGFTIDHDHNHLGKCWWELRKRGSRPDREAMRHKVEKNNVERDPEWDRGEHHRYRNCELVEDKEDDPESAW